MVGKTVEKLSRPDEYQKIFQYALKSSIMNYTTGLMWYQLGRDTKGWEHS